MMFENASPNPSSWSMMRSIDSSSPGALIEVGGMVGAGVGVEGGMVAGGVVGEGGMVGGGVVVEGGMVGGGRVKVGIVNEGMVNPGGVWAWPEDTSPASTRTVPT